MCYPETTWKSHLTYNTPNDLLSSIDSADPASRILTVGKKLGFRFRQKTDHILVRHASAFSSAEVVPHPEQWLFEVSDHLPIRATVETRSPE